MSRRIALRACHLYPPFREALAVVCSWVADTWAPNGTVSEYKSTTAFTLLLFGCIHRHPSPICGFCLHREIVLGRNLSILFACEAHCMAVTACVMSR